jgi:DNA-binding NarL/FixJ family response regulator
MNKRKLFLVEDDPMFAEMLKDHLKARPQWEVIHFSTGEKAIGEAFQQPEVVIIDYHLDNMEQPGLNGIETMVQMKKICPTAHYIFLSGQQKYGVALQTISHGAEQYIFKDEAAFTEINQVLDRIPA